MYKIPQQLISNFTDYFIEKSGKYDYFNKIVKFSIKNRKDIEEAIVYVFNSGIAFQTGAQRYKDHESKNYLSEIASYIYEYFNNRKGKENTLDDEFDKLHEKLCNLFLERTKELGKEYTYGNAQKLINMTFKYLACFKDYSEFSELFEYCHTPIDSIILKNYFLIGVNNISARSKKYLFNNNEYCWTKLNKDAYKSLVRDYRNRIKEINQDCSALLFDFYNWAPRGVDKEVKVPSVVDINGN